MSITTWGGGGGGEGGCKRLGCCWGVGRWGGGGTAAASTAVLGASLLGYENAAQCTTQQRCYCHYIHNSTGGGEWGGGGEESASIKRASEQLI